MNETTTTIMTFTTGEVLAGLKMAFPENVRLQAMPIGAVNLEAASPMSLTLSWKRAVPASVPALVVIQATKNA